MSKGGFPKTVLVIGWVWPEPKASAAGDHMISILTLLLDQNCDITFSSPAQRTELSAPLESLGIHCRDIEINNESFDVFVTALNPDLVIFDRYMMEEQFGWRVEQACPEAIRVLDTEDLHSLREHRQQCAKSTLNESSIGQTSQSELHSDKGIREVAAIYRCDLSLIISKTEVDLLINDYQIPPAILQHLPFRLPIEHEARMNREPSLPFSERKDFITIGNFRHPPNWDSVLWLKKLWPEIRRQLPGVNLHIYGAYLPKKASDLHNPKQGFLVHGWIDDAFDAMSQARVCLSPLKFGAGLKGKLLLAMAAGTPSVTTGVGAESMTTGLWPGAIVDTDEDIVSSAISLYNDENQWQKAHQTAHAMALKDYGVSGWGSEFIQNIERLSEDLPSYRSKNFIGQILRHQHHRATKFMSQWIEAKNKLSEFVPK